MDVVIIVLCWRFKKNLPALLDSITQQKTRYRFATIICCNEAESSPMPAGDKKPDVHWIFTGGNRGYGGGNNFAISWARARFAPRYFFCLNSDVLLTDGALDAIVGWADAHPKAAVIGAVQKIPQHGGATLYCGCRYSPALSLISRVIAQEGARIDYVNGGAVLLKSEVFPGSSVFIESYFLFFEELELTRRVALLGYQTGYCPDCIVLHHEGATRNSVASTDYCPEVSEYFENLNALRFTRDHYPHYLPTVFLFRFFGKFFRLLLKGKSKHLMFWYLALTDFLRSRIRRFPFQAGWCPAEAKDRVFDAKMPR